jgi:hypothetical protein
LTAGYLELAAPARGDQSWPALKPILRTVWQPNDGCSGRLQVPPCCRPGD